MTKRVAFLGPVGTYSQEAAVRYDPAAELLPFPSISAVALAVGAGMAEEGVVPIENSLEGAVPDTLDLLIHEPRLAIRNELVLPINHCLLSKPGVEAPQLQVIYSHPQALGQCRGFLERCFPKAQLIASLSTAAAVQDMKESKQTAAAIGPERAAELHGAQVLARGIQDNKSNVTRFVALAHKDHEPTGRDKTSLAFSYKDDVPGLLYETIGQFARRNINLAKIESRPTKLGLGKYIFLIDCEGHRTDPIVAEAIDAVRPLVSMLRIFGSYPRWKAEGE